MEEFSFPTIANEARLAVSSLWFVPSELNISCLHRRSFSSAESAFRAPKHNLIANSPALSDDGGLTVESEERMDMMWEDFSEDLLWPKSNSEGEVEALDAAPAISTSSLGDLGFCRLPHRKQPSLLVMLKVLKKLFLVQRKPSTKKIASCQL